MAETMRASMFANKEREGSIQSFEKSEITLQRRYVWQYITKHPEQSCLYIDWSGDISRHNRPPSMPQTMYTCEIEHVAVLHILEELIKSTNIRIIVFDPFVSHKHRTAPLFARLKSIIDTHGITLFLLIEHYRAPLFQAEIYIDPRR